MKFNSNQKWNDDKCWCQSKQHSIFEKDYIRNSSTYTCENSKYLPSIIDDSAITFDEIIDVVVKSNDKKAKAVSTNFNEKYITCKTQYFCISPAFLLITIAFLISVSIYCHLVKYWAKQKHLLPFHETNNELKKFFVNNIL